MGLQEKASYLLSKDMHALLQSGEAWTPEQFRAFILSLDGYRNSLRLSLRRHTTEEEHLSRRLDRSELAIATWTERVELARQRAPDYLDAAAERLEKERSQAEQLREQHRVLSRALANLKANLEKVERSLRVVRRKKRLLVELGSQGAGEDTMSNLRTAAFLAEQASGGRKELDPLEAVFQALEHAQVAGRFKRDGGRVE